MDLKYVTDISDWEEIISEPGVELQYSEESVFSSTPFWQHIGDLYRDDMKFPKTGYVGWDRTLFRLSKDYDIVVFKLNNPNRSGNRAVKFLDEKEKLKFMLR